MEANLSSAATAGSGPIGLSEALAAGAAGVHVGDEDLPVDAVRRVVGPDLVVGYSTHSVEEVEAAAGLAALVREWR